MTQYLFVLLFTLSMCMKTVINIHSSCFTCEFGEAQHVICRFAYLFTTIQKLGFYCIFRVDSEELSRHRANF